MSDFHERMHAAGIYGLWELASKMTKHPEPRAIAHMWPSTLLEAMVREAGEAVPIGEERRALQLFNPGLEGQWATTNTMIAAIQLLLPGEVARAHRHTPTAIRFIMEGEGAYTSVDGERVYMAPGDLILTPSWAWHDHGNATDKPVVWMDGLDVPLIQALNAMFFQMYDQEKFPLTKPDNASAALHGHVSLSPSWALHEHANTSTHDAAILFSIQDRPVLEALGLFREEALTEGEGHQAVTSTFKVT